MHILIIPGVTMPKVEDSVMARIRETAGPDAKITLAKSPKEAEAVMDDVEVILGVITPEMVRAMAPDPIVFAMANPDPEVLPEDVLKVRPDAVMATGRSDYPNQVNNVLGFPFIFRGALDTMATAINEEMKMAAVRALAQLAREDVPETVSRAYGELGFRRSPDSCQRKRIDNHLRVIRDWNHADFLVDSSR